MRRIDLDGDNKISYFEFSEAFNPITLSIVSHPQRNTQSPDRSMNR